ncbi:LPS export ABC transporter periplasmic protein LptC [Paramagnetospirillum kuznetsovii]|uniref:LPS export ABC transporter periplasmic protein LptC n=2 Tax=Paramagnetospirillum kuznetsovii TaxID=2053833 RepID=A0A364P4A0_9PROT|nr:LPS export ABC transporter periplasmic protein LptC [Paramagnetospirillum kuznetsovii]
MKVLLPSLAALLLALVVVWPKLAMEDKRFQIGFANLPSAKVETLAMQNARYFGVDESNRPFAVTSDLAVQEPGNSDLIHLQAPKADFTSSSGANIVVDAVTGLYHQSTKILDLSGGVNLYHDAGYELHTPTAVIDLGHNSGKGFDPVDGHGPQGRIESTGFELAGKGREIIFTGKAHLSLKGASPKGQGKGAKSR